MREKSFAQRIKEQRERLGISQREAARKWRFAQTTLSSWESGTRIPAGLYLERLERILKRSEWKTTNPADEELGSKEQPGQEEENKAGER